MELTKAQAKTIRVLSKCGHLARASHGRWFNPVDRVLICDTRTINALLNMGLVFMARGNRVSLTPTGKAEAETR